MKSKYFKIDFKEGIYFSKFSGDKNQIHLNDLVGHNSIYGEKIVHGVYILLKFLKIKNFDYKNMCKLSINFIGHASYDKKIFYKIKKNKKYKSITIFHNKFRGICEIKIYYNQKNSLLKVPSTLKINKTFKTKNKKIKNIDQRIVTATSYLSNYVGEIYPGKNSIIRSLEIFIFKKNIYQKNVICKSKIFKKGYPLILNYLTFKNIFIKFVSIRRPKLNIVLKKPTPLIIDKIKKIKNDVLVIGGSSGIGYDILKLLSYNKKINIYVTYNKNKIRTKNISSFKFDLLKDEEKIYKFLRERDNLNIYYLSSPKIILNNFSNDYYQILNKFFYEVPKNIVGIIKDKNINLFYPSTEFISTKNKSFYTTIKLRTEKMLEKHRSKKNEIKFYRLPKINTKQNLSLIYEKLYNFRDLLFKDKKLQKNFFFRN